jgi:2-oxoglutarate ferredoxin oxidoreductase subunit gamma
VPSSRAIKVPITRRAVESSGKSITANVVALGVLVGLTGVVSRQAIEKAISARAPKGTEAMNKAALEAGFTAADLLSKKKE